MHWRVTPGALRFEPLDALTAVYHRPSGRTHLLTEPAPQILAVLAEPADLETLRDRLRARYDIDGDDAALGARVAELAEAGLVAPA